MARWGFVAATIASAFLLAVSVVLFLSGYVDDVRDNHVSLSESLHIGVLSHGLDGRLAFFNDAEYGPYQGSIIALTDGTSSPFIREEAYGDSWGIYYRYFERPDSVLWTLLVSLWYPIALFSILPAICLFRTWRSQRISDATGS